MLCALLGLMVRHTAVGAVHSGRDDPAVVESMDDALRVEEQEDDASYAHGSGGAGEGGGAGSTSGAGAGRRRTRANGARAGDWTSPPTSRGSEHLAPNMPKESAASRLIKLVATGDTVRVQKVLEAQDGSVDVNGIDEHRGTPLIWSVIKGFGDISALLLKSGAFVDLPDNDNNTPLLWAAWSGHIPAVKVSGGGGGGRVVVWKGGGCALSERYNTECGATHNTHLLENCRRHACLGPCLSVVTGRTTVPPTHTYQGHRGVTLTA